MYKMKLELGDTSSDGHGKTATILLKSSVDVSAIRKAYKDSCYLTDIQFNSNEKFTKTKYNWEDSKKHEVVVKYEDSCLRNDIFIKLSKFGLTHELMSSFGFELEDDRYTLYEGSFPLLWIWFVKLSLPKDTVLEIENDDVIPSINNGPQQELNTQIGYGLFY